MTRGKLLAVWLLVIVGGFVLSLQYANRNYRLLVSEGQGEDYSVMAEAGAHFVTMFLLSMAILVPISLLGVLGRLKLKRISARHENAGSSVAFGVWNAHLPEGSPIKERAFSGIGAITTVLLADEKGLHLLTGRGDHAEAWSASWDSIVEIGVEEKSEGARSKFAPAMAIRISEPHEAMSLYVVADTFPWFSASGSGRVQELTSRLRALWTARTSR